MKKKKEISIEKILVFPGFVFQIIGILLLLINRVVLVLSSLTLPWPGSWLGKALIGDHNTMHGEIQDVGTNRVGEPDRKHINKRDPRYGFVFKIHYTRYLN